ncbi:hypothetical protein ABT039_07110 [Streptomyces lasiicapitis]|uniref:hypothetical protein n=1 Tax=Streptomyces lasiicapitis TaxID=1923961 RepID=UPI003324E4A9
MAGGVGEAGACAQERILELRGQIDELAGHLAEQEDVVSRLEITRETMTEILSGGGPVTGPDEETESEGGAGAPEEPVVEADRCEVGSPVGVRLVPPWTDQLGVEALPDVYADIVEVLADAVHPMRAHQLCSVLGLSTDKSKDGQEQGGGLSVEAGDTAPQGRAPGRGTDSVVAPRAGEQKGSRA